MTNRVANIQQLISMPDRWEFHYLVNGEESPELCRVPMLGLALVSIPILIQLGEETHSQDIVHFGLTTEGDSSRFVLYGSDSLDVFPFFTNNCRQRALGVAPSGSPDDYFEDVIATAAEQLAAERRYGKDEVSLYRRLSKKLGKDFAPRLVIDGFENFFRITTGSCRDQGVAKDWEKVMASLNEARTQGGDDEIIEVLLSASKLSPLEVSEVEVAS